MDLVPIFAHRWLPSIGSGFCSTAERDELEAVFAPIMKSLPTTARGVSESLEKVELCAALADAKRDEVTAYFK
jgi:alanyl aminopeptidase